MSYFGERPLSVVTRMRLLFILLFLASACSPQNMVVQSPNLDEIVEYLQSNPIPFPDFISDVTREIEDDSAYEICVYLNNGVLGAYTDNQTSLVRDHSDIYINMSKDESLLYYENMILLTDSDGNSVDTGISSVCSRLSESDTMTNKAFLAVYELSFDAKKFTYMWAVQSG